ncbi:unnamed protein product [Rotaria sp. Silwood1]|nr:unnamed protein product [Rotaria sp. Silwood1]CAF1299435.1 unnamed protein product [Rotaria sp. Silwood1]
MGKRGRPPKRKSVTNTPSKRDQCYTILSSDDETGNKKETLRLPSPSQRRGVGNERNGTIIITPPDRTISSTNSVEKNTPVTRNNNNNNNNTNNKKIIINHNNKDSNASGDTDATEVYSVSNDDDEDYTEKAPKVSPIKRKRKPPVVKVNHALSENSDDDLTYSRRSINIKQKKRQETSSSSSLSSDDSQSRKRARPPIPTFKRAQAKKKKKNFDETSDDDVVTDEDYHTDVEKMDDKALIKKTEQRMLHDEDLTVMTKQALEDERQRVQRIQERQSQLPPSSQILTDDDDNDDEEDNFSLDNKVKKEDEKKETKSLIFEYDSNTNKPLIWVLPELIAKMKPHQLDGTMFLWDNVFESIAQIKKNNIGTGCILAHHMGLGKTFQLISFLHTIFKHSDITRTRTCLILCPVNVISNWAAEFSYWLSGVRPTIKVYQFSLFKTKSARWERLEKWNDKGGVMLMGYEIYRRLSNDADYNFFLSDPGPDIIVCDEGHVLKNAKAGISKALNKIRTKRRIILTGTPLQNNLREYYYMVHFVKPHLLGTYREFKNQFIDPIRAGQHKDSNIYAVQLMKRRAFALHERLQHCTHRRDFNVLRKYLPEKYEYVIKIYMCDLQKQLYNKYLKIQNIDPSTGFNTAKLFADYQYLMKIWTHPWLLRPHFIDRWKKQQKNNDNESDKIDPFFDDIFAGLSDDDMAVEDEPQKKQSAPNKRLTTKMKTGESNHHRHKKDEDDGNSSSNSSSSTSEFLALFNNTNWKQYTSTSSSASARASTTSSSYSTNDPCQQAMNDEWWFSFFDNTAEYDISLSGKLTFLKTLLDECEQIGDKVLLFSRSLFSLSYLEQYLKYWDSLASGKKIQADDFDAKVKPNGRWKFGIDYFRIDGSTDIATRTSYIGKFNDAANIRSRLFIVSTMAGGIGINLIGSNRVVIFDCSWNPSSDLQALFRSYRLGQKKATYVYRLLSKGSMEERIYFRQVNKQAMAQRVVDAQQLARHFTESELRELYSFKPEEDEPQEYKLQTLPDDIILRNCVEKNPKLIQNILEHDSLLENHIEEQLTREEKYYALKELERDERQAEYQSTIAKTLANLANKNNNNNNNNNNNTNFPQISSETTSNDSKKDRKIITAPPLNTYNPYQPPPPMCAQARAGISTAQEARGLERLTELLFPKEAPPLPAGKAAELPPLKEVTDMPVSKDEIADINLDDEDFDPRTKKEKQKALLQEQRALVKLYNDKKKLLNPPKVPKVLKRPKKLPAVNTAIITNPYQFMPVTLNPFDMPPKGQTTCRFADLFTIDDLVYNRNDAIHRFKMHMCLWEGKFGYGVGYNHEIGITYDGHKIDYTTGDLHENLQYWTAASKEALHVNMLSLYLMDDIYARQFFGNTSQDDIVQILERKIASYNDFHRRYPGFGGFLPWFAANGSAMNLLNGWESKVPGLDNGQLIWSIKILIETLKTKKLFNLADKYEQRIELMTQTSIPVFYEAERGGIRCESGILNMFNESQTTNPNNYVTRGTCLLDDPYEGELMAYFMDLYAPWTLYNYTMDERNRIWTYKRARLVRDEYNTSTQSTNVTQKQVTVQRGFWFSSHEQWKYFYLPYRDIDLQNRLFTNGEKVRVYHSAQNYIPGLYASVASDAKPGTYQVDYWSACGIQQIAFQPIEHESVVTPYASFPVIMANESIGLAWYLNMLQGPAMQNMYGSTEATNVNGQSISPVITWDSKITTVVAMLSSHLIDVSREILKRDRTYERFYNITEFEWSRVFGSKPLLGEDLLWSLPSVKIPRPTDGLPDFTQCRNALPTSLSTTTSTTSYSLSTINKPSYVIVTIVLFAFLIVLSK